MNAEIEQLGTRSAELDACSRHRVGLFFESVGGSERSHRLISALKRALDHSQRIASMAVVVDAKDNPAKAFYKNYGFLELPDHRNRLFLSMKTIEQMISTPG